MQAWHSSNINHIPCSHTIFHVNLPIFPLHISQRLATRKFGLWQVAGDSESGFTGGMSHRGVLRGGIWWKNPRWVGTFSEVAFSVGQLSWLSFGCVVRTDVINLNSLVRNQ